MAHERSLLEHLRAIRPGMAKAAQAVYESWEQNEEGVDEELGTGGICDQIAEALAGVIYGSIKDVAVDSGGQEGDDHAWLVVVASGSREAYGVDIPCRIYETGGGYSWKKRPEVVFQPEDVQIFKVPYPEKELEMGTSEGGTNIRGNRFEADLARNKKVADIRDRKNSRLITILNREDIQELHDLTAELLSMLAE
jgi:hypothetical protein